MPKRSDIKTILLIGSGPIIIGQGCEFDYSGTQACKALKEEGYRIVLINSNPATIMTDPEFADRTYIEPVTVEAIEKILQTEKDAGTPVDALLPTLGGQTGLNTAVEAADKGVLDKFGVEMIGANRDVIHKAEDRKLFKDAMLKIGLELPKSGLAYTMDDGRKLLKEIGLPCVIRPSFTLGGHGGGIAYNEAEYEEIVARGIEYSRINEVLIEESVLGWKEYELEVMRDKADNVVIICSIENLDPMGIHTGDSITVAPAQTLTDKEYQRMRDATIAIMREIGVETGGSNVQFAINPQDGRMIVVEMNPRVSRSSALASKATGFPIAKIAAKLAVGYTLDEIRNDITRMTPASFEPTIDYVVTKIPRWTFEKFPEASEVLTTQMKSVGEAMSIGRTFKESLQKGIRSMEIRRTGLGLDRNDKWLAKQFYDGKLHAPANYVRPDDSHDGKESAAKRYPIVEDVLKNKLTVPCQGRLYYIRYAFKMGWSVAQIHSLTKIDPWFLENIRQLVEFENTLCSYEKLETVPAEVLREAKQLGYSDAQLAMIWDASEMQVRKHRKSLGIEPVYKLVDTCAAEFEAYTPYYYSTYETPATVIGKDGTTRWIDDEVRVSDKKKVVILGGGPNRIGQGIEFDYCCVHAAFAARELGFEAVMVNSNPETVSTDYDTSDLLFFEPLTLEDVLNICDKIKPWGVIVQFGGQTPLNLSQGLAEAGVPIIGTSVDSIALAEDREKFHDVLKELNLRQPPNGLAKNVQEAVKVANEIGYPVLVRPGFVLGGRGMEIVYDDKTLASFIREAEEYSHRPLTENPVLIDKFLELATEVDVDTVSDGKDVVVAGVMEHIEEAGIHSGDSACALPPYSLSHLMVDRIIDQAEALARRLKVKGLMNVQFAVKDDQIFVLEVNPRASRTVPFVSKATGIPWAKNAAKVMMGKTLAELGITRTPWPRHTSVKESVFPFIKFQGVDVILGPEMRSTGEVMGIDDRFSVAFAKSQIAAGSTPPTQGNVFVSVRRLDKTLITPIARELAEMGFNLICTEGTYDVLHSAGVPCRLIPKISEGKRPNIIDMIAMGEIHMLINTPTRKGRSSDEGRIRSAAVIHEVPIFTTITAARAVTKAIRSLRETGWSVKPIQAYHNGKE
jgi:carbamoyl-phosphate synthase large subunit